MSFASSRTLKTIANVELRHTSESLSQERFREWLHLIFCLGWWFMDELGADFMNKILFYSVILVRWVDARKFDFWISNVISNARIRIRPIGNKISQFIGIPVRSDVSMKVVSRSRMVGIYLNIENSCISHHPSLKKLFMHIRR